MERELNEKQLLFCKNYVSKDFFGSGVESYAAAYGLDLTNQKDYNNAKVAASKLLTNSNILSRINEELDAAGLNDNFVDKQLLFAITQNADLSSKVRAIQEYNKLKQRIIEKLETKNNNKITVEYVSTASQSPNDTENKTNYSSN
jgi:phage terminase small subunit